MKNYNRVVGRVLAELREDANLTQAEVAAALGVGQSNISHLEHGRQAINVEQLKKFALAVSSSPHRVIEIAESRCNNERPVIVPP